MKLPREVPVMTLPNATLFPQSLLPLRIFEPRYRRMLRDCLLGQRIFAVAMQNPARKRASPLPIAGVGLIRVAVSHADGTSHLILQGLARVELRETVTARPYLVKRLRPLESPPCNGVVVDALLAKVRELLEERIQLGLPFPSPFSNPSHNTAAPPGVSGGDLLKDLDQVHDPEQVTDLVCCAVLPGAIERQLILETVHLESRLKHLIHFLMAEIKRKGKDRHR